ncbi:hypothetical protein PWT90_05187 [Aphanocladium album]|nr:hypothetical protein PWT90_05187 [Aphanocladium album]
MRFGFVWSAIVATVSAVPLAFERQGAADISSTQSADAVSARVPHTGSRPRTKRVAVRETRLGRRQRKRALAKRQNSGDSSSDDEKDGHVGSDGDSRALEGGRGSQVTKLTPETIGYAVAEDLHTATRVTNIADNAAPGLHGVAQAVTEAADGAEYAVQGGAQAVGNTAAGLTGTVTDAANDVASNETDSSYDSSDGESD